MHGPARRRRAAFTPLCELFVYDLNTDTHVLGDLGKRKVRLLPRLDFVAAQLRFADLREVAHDFLDVSNVSAAFRRGAAPLQPAEAEAGQKPLAPRCEGSDTRFQRLIVVGQVRLETELEARQCARRFGAQRLESRFDTPRSDRVRGAIAQRLSEPLPRGFVTAGAQRSAQAAVQLGGRHQDARRTELVAERFVGLTVGHRSRVRVALDSRFNAITVRHCVDPSRRRLYIPRMSNNHGNERFDIELKRLEKRLDELVVICRQLREENHSLKQRQETLMAERASLLQKNEQVRGRVEAMVTRLKAMEQAS